jgi:hypothetical protein
MYLNKPFVTTSNCPWTKLFAKTIRNSKPYCSMPQEVSNDLKDLIFSFVQTYSNVPDLELAQFFICCGVKPATYI